MATGKSYFPRQNYRFLTSDHVPLSTDHSVFELDESDLFNNSVAATLSNSPEFRKAVTGSRFRSNSAAAGRSFVGGTASSLPVNIPDWSKILKDEYRENRRRDFDDEDDDEDDDDDVDGEDCLNGMRVPPHEFLARTRIASFSVHEGVGRTLKGRDLSKVRNAIWEKTGFQD